MANGDPREQGIIDVTYTDWEPTDWTQRQRVIAICSLLLLALSCGLIAGAFGRWRTKPLAVETFASIGVMMLCLGALLLNSVFWYAYLHDRNHVGGQARMELPITGMLVLPAVVALATLAMLLVGSTLAATGTGSTWQLDGSVLLLPLGLIILLFAVMLSISPSLLKWRPTCDPSQTDHNVNDIAMGWRFALRWVVMLLAQNVWLLIGTPLFVIFQMLAHQIMGNAVTPIPLQALIGLFGVAAAFFLIAALSELTHRPHAPTTPRLPRITPNDRT